MGIATGFANAAEYDIQFKQGWNLISLTRSGASLQGIAGDKVSTPAFCSRRGIFQPVSAEEELQPGLGYWVFSNLDLRIPQNSANAQARSLSPVDLMAWNLVGPLETPQDFHALNDLAWDWQFARYRGIFTTDMAIGRGYSLYPDDARAALSISSAEPVSPTPGLGLSLTVTGAQYLAAGGVVWFNSVPAPVIATDSATIRVIAPPLSGTVDLILDAGHGVMSATFPITMPAQSPSLSKSALRSDLQALASTVANTLDQQHDAVADGDITLAQAQLLALDSLLNEFLASLSSEQRDSALLVLEGQDVRAHLAVLSNDIAGRSIPANESMATVQAALTPAEPFALQQKLADLRTQQLAALLAQSDADSLLNWLAFAAMDRILDIAHALTDWTPSKIQDFRVDRTACDLPLDCVVSYFADFAIRHDPALYQPITESLIGLLSAELEATLLVLPADFAAANSANAVRNDAQALLTLALTAVNAPSLVESAPRDLLLNASWLDLEIDMPWMEANGRGYFDTVFSAASRGCDDDSFRVEGIANSPSLRIVSQAPGFGRLDAAILDRDRSRIFSANAEFGVEPGIPILQPAFPVLASSGPFFDDANDDVHSASYSITVGPAPPTSALCFQPAASVTLAVSHPAIRLSEVSTQLVSGGIALRQAVVLEPGPAPLIDQTTYQVFAGTTTSVGLDVIGFDLPLTVFGVVTVDDGLDDLRSMPINPIEIGFDLPVKEVFDNSIEISLLSASAGTASFFPTGANTFFLEYEIANIPGTTAVLTVSTGVNGIGDDSGALPPNRTEQELLLEVIKAPLSLTAPLGIAFQGASVTFDVGREFGVELLPDEEAALSLSVTPSDDIVVAGTTVHIGQDATPGFRTVSVNVGEPESAELSLDILEDRLSVFLLDTIGYTNADLEFFYFFDSGAVPPLDDLTFSVLPADDITIEGSVIRIGANAEAGTRSFTASFGAKSASVDFDVVKDVLNVFPVSPSVFEGSSYSFSLFFDSGRSVGEPLVSISPAADVTIADGTVAVAFGAALGARTFTAVANGSTGHATLTVVDDGLTLSADKTGAFGGSTVTFSVGRESGAAVTGQVALSVAPPEGIVVNGLVLEVAEGAALGTRTVTATVGGDTANVSIEILGDARFIAIDLSAGADAASYPVTRFGTLADPQAVLYKTSTLLLRRVSERSFTMGSPAGELGRKTDEVQHVVTFSSHSYMGVFEVTQRQWELVMGNLPSGNAPVDYETLPVENVSYEDIRGAIDGSTWPTSSAVDASSFVGRLQARTGLGIDLPTEAQWEIACRAGTSTALNNGTNLSDVNTDANLDLLGLYANNASGSSGSVGQLLPNALGIYDMHGNVWEWCRDWYGEFSGAAADPLGATTGTRRIVRGGSFLLGASHTRSANRGQLPASTKNTFFGLRLAAPGAAGTP